MCAKRKREYFFDSPPTSSGDRFRSQNIPSQNTYAELLESVPFFEEGTSMANNYQQGLVMINDDATAIRDRNESEVQAGRQYVLTRWQAPGIGVNDNGTYKESSPVDAWTNGSPVIGSGMKITGIAHQFGGGKRIGYQVELDISSLDLVSSPDMDTVEFPVYDPVTKKHYKLVIGRLSGKDPSSSKTWNQDSASNIWNVKHDLGYKPGGVSVEIEVERVPQIVEAFVRHVDNNNLIIELTSVEKGKAYLS